MMDIAERLVKSYGLSSNYMGSQDFYRDHVEKMRQALASCGRVQLEAKDQRYITRLKYEVSCGICWWMNSWSIVKSWIKRIFFFRCNVFERLMYEL